MHDDLDLRHFSGVTRLFPLGNVVMFPHVVLPLHIFEPRYRQMTQHALGDDKLITIVQALPGRESPWGLPEGEPALAAVGCLGRILNHVELEDGRYNFLLLGRKRVRILGEVEASTLYRQARVELLEDRSPPVDAAAQRQRLIDLFLEVQGPRAGREMREVLDRIDDLGAVTDVLAHVLEFDASGKQALLDLPDVTARSAVLTAVLEQRAGGTRDTGPRRPWPPTFSDN
jgi:Lon protease-like protein